MIPVSSAGIPARKMPATRVGVKNVPIDARFAGDLAPAHSFQPAGSFVRSGVDSVSLSGSIPSKGTQSQPDSPQSETTELEQVGQNREPKRNTGKGPVHSGSPSGSAPKLTPPRVASPKLSLPGKEMLMPQLRAQDVEVSPDRRVDRMPLWEGPLRLVEYRDLRRAKLLPAHGISLPSLDRPLLCSRLIMLDRERVGALLYVPGPKGQYIPRPVYQSSSRGLWQAPHFILRGQSLQDDAWRVRYFGTGEKARGKMQTALDPDVQAFLSGIQLQHPPDERLNRDDILVLTGTAHNSLSPDETFDQAERNRAIPLEELYPGSRIDSVGPKVTDAKVTPLSAWRFKLPTEARPDFSRCELSYETQTKMYGAIHSEVYPSRDDQLRWTYFRQRSTGRVWVAAAHLKDQKMVDTGLPFKLVNIGNTVPLAPYEFHRELAGLQWLPVIPGTSHVDIWKKYTSKGPLVQAYYKAKGLPVPK